MVWSGLGVNYKGLQASWAQDADYFRSIGLKNIRPNMSWIPASWTATTSASQGNFSYWRACAAYFASQGFWVTWGPAGLNNITAGTMTATNWQQYHDSVVAEAAYLQSQGITLGCFELGNEMDGQPDGTTLTRDQFITNMKQLATDLKAVYTLSPVGYSMWNYNGDTYSKWIAAGRGNIDIVGVHPYGNIAANCRYLNPGGYSDIQAMLTAFGADHCIVTEFNLDASNANTHAMADDLRVNQMRIKYAFLKTVGFTKAVVYSWVGYLEQDNAFAMKNIDGSFSTYWDALLTDNKRRTYIN